MKVVSTPQSRTARSSQDGVARTQQGGAAGAANAAGASSSAANTSGDDSNVSLSSLSSQLRSLAASGAADIDTAQVDAIKEAIRSGTLQIDTGKIADGVLETARSLLKPSSGS